MNIKKFKFIAYGYKTPLWADSINLSLGIEKLERVLAMKYLGIIMDEKLTWREQSLHIQGKMRGINYIFYHLKKYINQNHLKKLYQPLYESNLNYGIIHWGGSAHIRPIKVLQNKVCRSIMNLDPRTSETEIYRRMGKFGWKFEDLNTLRSRLCLFSKINQNSK